jgi:hypothetical protein
VQDLSVQHRQANMAHARSVLLGQSGSAAAAAAAAVGLSGLPAGRGCHGVLKMGVALREEN